MASGHRYDVAFIVVTYNSAQHIRKCIESIRTYAFSVGHSSAIIVVDNASTDETVLILSDIQKSIREMHVILLDRNIGFGPANNVGFSEVHARYYVLLNADAWLIADSISPVLAAVESYPEIAICGLPLVYPDGSAQTSSHHYSSWKKWLLYLLGFRALALRLIQSKLIITILSRFSSVRDFVRKHSQPVLRIDHIRSSDFSGVVNSVDWVCGAAILIAGDFVLEVDGFDPNIILYGEDEDLCIEARRRGRKIVVIDTAPVVHVHGWGRNRFNRNVADLKYASLRYFIQKHIVGSGNRIIMKILLPFYVYGCLRFYYVWMRNPDMHVEGSKSA